MTRAELVADTRRKIGNKPVNEVSNPELETYVEGALERIASELRYPVRTDTTTLGLVAGLQEMMLPADLVEIISLYWNGQRLQSSSLDAYDRLSIAWRGIASSTPQGFAVQGRTLFLNPPPTAAAIVTDPVLTLRGVWVPEFLPASGAVALGTLDHRLAAWLGARQYLLVHPTQENLARAQSYETEIAPLLKSARRHARQMIRDYRSSWRIRPGRAGAAR